jgi:hypothetical protein
MLELLDIWLQFMAGLVVAGGIITFVLMFIAQGWYYNIKNFFKKLFKKD